MSPPVPAQDADSLLSQWQVPAQLDDLGQAEDSMGDLMDLQSDFGNQAVSTLLEEDPSAGGAGGPETAPEEVGPMYGPWPESQWDAPPGEGAPVEGPGTAPEDAMWPAADGGAPAPDSGGGAGGGGAAPAGPALDAGGGGGGGAGGAGPDPAGGAEGAGPGVDIDASGGPVPEAPEPAASELADTGASELGTGDLALIDEELAEHARWGAAAGAVGDVASPERAEFVANAVSSGMGESALQGAGMAVLISGGTKLAERAATKFIPVPAVGAIIGGVLASAATWDAYQNWDKPGGGGEALANIGEGASGYEVAANTIQGIVTILDVAANLLDIIGGISGIVAAACSVAILASLGTLAPALGPVVAVATKIAVTISIVTGIMNIVKMAIQPLVVMFRALHSFYSEADPREVEAQGAGLASAGADLAGTVGGLAGGMATEAAAGRMGDPPPSSDRVDGLDPSPPRDTPPQVEVDPATGPRSTEDPAGAFRDLSDAEIDASVSHLGPDQDAGAFRDLSDAEIDSSISHLDQPAAASAPAAAPPAAGGPRLEPLTAPLQLEAIPPNAPVPQGVEPGAIGHYDPLTSRPDYDPHPFALESNPPGAPGASRAGGQMPKGVREEAGVFAEHGTASSVMAETVPGYEQHGPNGERRKGHDTRHQPTISVEQSTKGHKDAADAAALADIQQRKAAGEDVPWIEAVVGGNERLRDAAQAGGSQAPGYQHTKDFMAEVDYVHGRFHEEVRPGEPFPGPNPFEGADTDAHVDAAFAPFMDPPARGPEPLFDGDIGPDVDRAFEGMQRPADPLFDGDIGPDVDRALDGMQVPEPSATSSPMSRQPEPLFDGDIGPDVDRAFDAATTDPRLLDPSLRQHYETMEGGSWGPFEWQAGGRDFEVGGPMSRRMDMAEGAPAMGGTVADAKDLQSLLFSGGDAPSTASTARPGAGAYAAVRGEDGAEATGADLAEARAEAEANVEPVNPQYPEPPGSEADLAKMEDDIEIILRERAQAEADAAEMEASAAVAEGNQADAEAVASRTTSTAGPAAQAHAAAVARREQRNKEQQDRLKQSEEKTAGAAEEFAGTAALVSLLGVWSGFTGVMSYLPGSAGDAFEELNAEANTFIAQLTGAEELLASEQGAAAPRQEESAANEERIHATDEANQATQDTIGQAADDAGTIGEEQGVLAGEAHEVAEMAQGEADEADALAQDVAAEHETLAEQLQAWAAEHQAARAEAVAATVMRLQAEGYTVTAACDW